MKYVAVTLLLLLAGSAQAQQANVYGKDGRYQGSTYQYGNKTTFTDRHGYFTGSAVTNGRMTTFYDQHGHYQGSVTRR